MTQKPKIVEFFGGKIGDDYYELVSVFKYDERTRTYYMTVEFDFEKAFEKKIMFQRASDGKLFEWKWKTKKETLYGTCLRKTYRLRFLMLSKEKMK